MWLKVSPRSSGSDTGSETEVKYSENFTNFITVQESFISPESKITPICVSDTYNDELSDKNDIGKPLESSNELTLNLNAFNQYDFRC